MGASTSFFAMAWSLGCRRPCFGCIVKKDLGPDECQQLTLSRGFCGKWSEPSMCEPVAARDIWLVNRAFSKKDLRRRHGLLAYHQLHEVAVGSGDCVAGGTGCVFRGCWRCWRCCMQTKRENVCVFPPVQAVVYGSLFLGGNQVNMDNRNEVWRNDGLVCGLDAHVWASIWVWRM
jgi:hypothetical protein